MSAPVIGVTTSNRSGWRIFPLVAFNIWLAGGRAVRWGTGRDADLDAVDGVVIGSALIDAIDSGAGPAQLLAELRGTPS